MALRHPLSRQRRIPTKHHFRESIRQVIGPIAAGLAAAMALPASAAPIAYEFEGVLTGFQLDAGTLFPDATIGDTFLLRLSLDDGLIDHNGDPRTGTYADLCEIGGCTSNLIDALLVINGTARELQYPTSSGSLDGTRNTLSILDGQTILYGDGRQVEVEGIQFTSNPDDQTNSERRGSAFLRYWNEHPVGSSLTGAAGALASDALPTSLAGIGSVSPRADFGFFWGLPDDDFLQSYVGGVITSAQVVLNAAPNPDGLPWPEPVTPPAPGESPDLPLLPDWIESDGSGAATFVFELGEIEAGETVWIDPPVAIGYDYALYSDDASQSFMSLTIATDVGDGLYDVSWCDAEGCYGMSIATGEALSFGAGTTAFSVSGIEPEAQLDPEDATAFVAGVSFRESAPAWVYQTAQITDYTPPVPEPSTAAMMLAGAGVLASALRARRKLPSAT